MWHQKDNFSSYTAVSYYFFTSIYCNRNLAEQAAVHNLGIPAVTCIVTSTE